MSADVEVAVVGAGIAGLAAAATLQRAGCDVVLLEASARVGGAAWTDRIDDHLVERGPNTIRVAAPMEAFLASHGLGDRLVPAAPAARFRFLVRAGHLVPVPMGPVAFARTPLLTRGGKLRLLAEPLVARGDPTGETVAEFAKRRFGCETRDGLIGPFLTGVYAGDERQLGVEAVFPSLVEAERRSGSVVRGLLRGALARRGPRGRRGIWSTPEGLGGLVAAVAGGLGPALRLGARVGSIASEAGGFRLALEGGVDPEPIRARAVVLAAPAPAAAALLAGLDADAAKALAAIAYAPVASVAVSLGQDATRVPLDGFGYLVPRGEGEALLGCLFSSALFPGRAPSGRALLTLLAGGTRCPAALDWPDDRLDRSLIAELDRVLGLREAPRVLARTRWSHAVPQPGREHVRLVADVRARLARRGRIALAGAHLDGVAFGDALASGLRAAGAMGGDR